MWILQQSDVVEIMIAGPLHSLEGFKQILMHKHESAYEDEASYFSARQYQTSCG
jgi:hypothetical protein